MLALPTEAHLTAHLTVDLKSLHTPAEMEGFCNEKMKPRYIMSEPFLILY